MRFAREGQALILATVGMALVVFLAALRLRHWAAWVPTVAAAVSAVGLAFFFRDPARTGLRGPAYVLAPADGRVLDVGPAPEPTYMGGPATRIAIFLSIFDVHVNRYPVSGVVELKHREPGRFELAWREAAAQANDRASVGIATPHGRVLVRQIAGHIARRIVTYPEVGDRVEQGERMGMIKFGSRVEVFVPGTAVPLVRPGDRVEAGVTVVARFSEAS